jgi:hypothetical protein
MKVQRTAMVLATFLILVACPATAQTDPFELEALDAAKQIAHSDVVGLRVIPTGIRPAYVSGMAEAWTVRDADSGAGVILVFTGSQTFRCAMRPRGDYQCTIKLASVLTHEAWHLRYGADERHAYDQQLRFLEFHGASAEVLGAVRRARRFVLTPP